MDKLIERRYTPCRCGVEVAKCIKGCTLYNCCGGYIVEGHMSDCPGAKPEQIHGKYRNPRYTGEWS